MIAGKAKERRRKELEFYLATKLSWLLVLGLGRTARIRLVGRERLERLRERGERVIFTPWHGRMLMPIYVHRNEGICAMVSRHRDGEMIAQTIQRLGYRTVRGSTGKGGERAFWELVRAIRNGSDGAIIPDGPTGPRHRLKPGVLFIAQQAGAAIVPITFSASRKIEFNSWDRFTLWLPLAQSVVLYGEPTFIPREWSVRRVLQEGKRIERAMIELEVAADAYFSE